MKKIKQKAVAEFILENGLLFEINRKVLHPYGLALEIVVDDDDSGKQMINFGELWDCRDDPEGILFSDDAYKTGREKFQKFLNEHGSRALRERDARLGYVIQDDEHINKKE